MFRRLIHSDLRKLIIRAGFPYHEDPHLYQWLWVFILLPFLPEDTLNELCDEHGKKLRKLYKILYRHPEAFSRLLHSITIPLLFKTLEEYNQRDESYRSRHKPKIIIDDTKSEKFGKCMAFVKKLYDHGNERYIEAHNIVLVLVSFGDFVFPLTIMIWRPKTDPKHKSKNDLVVDFLDQLKREAHRRDVSLDMIDITFDSAYAVEKVTNAAKNAGLTVVSKAKSSYKFEFEGQEIPIREIIEIVKDRNWKNFVNDDGYYQRYVVKHRLFGTVVLVIRKHRCKNGKIIYDALFSTKLYYRAFQIHARYRDRWEIEMHFKYYKQYLYLGKSAYQKSGSIQSALYCVALAGLIVALYRHQASRHISFKTAVKRISQQLDSG